MHQKFNSIYDYESSSCSSKEVVASASNINESPMGLVKEALKKEISNMREFNARLDRQYQSLLQYVR